MIDSFGRNINYIRMSLTDRCQQKCTYCARENGGVCIRENEMTADDFIFAAEVFASLGFRKIRLTGGEPLLRKDIIQIVRGISGLNCYDDISLTTNGLELTKLCDALKEAGLDRINVSLDSTDGDEYRKITGADPVPVIEGIKKAVCTFDTVKINSVLIKGINDNPDGIISLARDYPVTVRFIELMPMGGKGEGISGSEILAGYPFLVPDAKEDIHSPETVYSAEGFRGKIGFINPVSNSFCKNCNRMRLTWDGKLRPCLGVDFEIDVRSAITERDRERLASLIEKAVSEKPEKNRFDDNFTSERPMRGIGG